MDSFNGVVRKGGGGLLMIKKHRGYKNVRNQNSFFRITNSDLMYHIYSTVSTSLTRRLIQKVDFGRKNIDIIWDVSI